MQLMFYQACYVPCSSPRAMTVAVKKIVPALVNLILLWAERENKIKVNLQHTKECDKCSEEKLMLNGLGMGHGRSLFKMESLGVASEKRWHLCKDLKGIREWVTWWLRVY